MRTLAIELLYIDIDTCSRCQGADAALDSALADAAPALAALDVDLSVTRTLVDSEDVARARRLTSSPSIRIDGRDIQPDFEESDCASCGTLVSSGSVDCRVWRWRDIKDTAPPKGLIVEALLRAALAPEPGEPPSAADFTLPDNLLRFFQSRKPSKAASCGCGC